MDMTWIIHPNLGPQSAHEVPTSAVRFHVQSGWALLAAENIPQPDDPAQPESLTVAEVATGTPAKVRRGAAPAAGGEKADAGGGAASSESEDTS